MHLTRTTARPFLLPAFAFLAALDLALLTVFLTLLTLGHSTENNPLPICNLDPWFSLTADSGYLVTNEFVRISYPLAILLLLIIPALFAAHSFRDARLRRCPHCRIPLATTRCPRCAAAPITCRSRLFTLATAVSLLLALLILHLWVQSFDDRSPLATGTPIPSTGCSFRAIHGEFAIEQPIDTVTTPSYSDHGVGPNGFRAGVQIATVPLLDDTVPVHYVKTRDWYLSCLFPLLCTLVLPAITLRNFRRAARRRNRIRQNLCPFCAYDLRTQSAANPTPRCPECGYTIQPA